MVTKGLILCSSSSSMVKSTGDVNISSSSGNGSQAQDVKVASPLHMVASPVHCTVSVFISILVDVLGVVLYSS